MVVESKELEKPKIKVIAGIQPIKASERAKYLKLLVYGQPGSGKTYLAGTATKVPELSPVLFIDVEGGTKTLTTYFPDAEIMTGRR